MPLRGLSIIVDGDERVPLALDLALATTALKAPVTVFLRATAVMAALQPVSAALDELLTAGATILVCQSSLDAAIVGHHVLDGRCVGAGLISVLTHLDDGRLIVL